MSWLTFIKYQHSSKPCPKYDNGTEERLTAGDVFYLPPGHTAIVEKDLKLIDFNPEKEFKEVMDHIIKKMTELSQ